MPFKSKAQRSKFGELVKQGKVSKETFKEWNSATPKDIPARVTPKKKTKTLADVVSYRKKKYGV